MKVALVHDDLVQWGGAERVLEALTEIYPDAPIYTSLFDNKNPYLKKAFGMKKVCTSFMQKIPFWKDIYRPLLPLYPIAFEQFDFSEFDLVISQTTRFAKSIITKPHTLHISYCHTPPRFLWNFSGEIKRKILSPYLSFLRFYDQASSKRVDRWIAGSKNAKQRIEKIYRMSGEVCEPFVDFERLKKIESFKGDYYLIISRLLPYKRVEIAIDCFKENGKKLKIVGVGPMLQTLKKSARKNIEFLGNASEELLINLISGCRGLVITAEEDFGLTALEAQALGKGVIAYGEGGSRETVIDGITGTFFYEQNSNSLKDALDIFEKLEIKEENCRKNAKKFSKERFKRRFIELVKSNIL